MQRSSVMRIAALLLLTAGLLLSLAPRLLSDRGLAVAEGYLSPDGVLQPASERTVLRVLRVTGLVSLLWGSVLIGARNDAPTLDWLSDSLAPAADVRTGGVILVGSTLLCLGAGVTYVFRSSWGLRLFYGEDGPAEWATVWLLFAASGLLAYVLAALRRHGTGRTRQLILLALALLMVVCGLVALEEISWGQRLFGWQTPLAWERLNDQGETNLHNMATPLFRTLRLGMAWALPLTLAAGWHGVRPRYGLEYAILFPHTSLWGLLCLLALASAVPLGELAELLMALGVAAYALRLALVASRVNRWPSDKTSSPASGAGKASA